MKIATLLQAATLLIAALIIAFIYSWKLTLVVIAFVPLVIIGGALQQRSFVGQAGKNQKQLEGAGMIAFEAINNFRTVTMLGLQDKFFRAYEEKIQLPLRNEVIKAHTYGGFIATVFVSFIAKKLQKVYFIL